MLAVRFTRFDPSRKPGVLCSIGDNVDVPVAIVPAECFAGCFRKVACVRVLEPNTTRLN